MKWFVCNTEVSRAVFYRMYWKMYYILGRPCLVAKNKIYHNLLQNIFSQEFARAAKAEADRLYAERWDNIKRDPRYIHIQDKLQDVNNQINKLSEYRDLLVQTREHVAAEVADEIGEISFDKEILKQKAIEEWLNSKAPS